MESKYTLNPLQNLIFRTNSLMARLSIPLILAGSVAWVAWQLSPFYYPESALDKVEFLLVEPDNLPTHSSETATVRVAFNELVDVIGVYRADRMEPRWVLADRDIGFSLRLDNFIILTATALSFVAVSVVVLGSATRLSIWQPLSAIQTNDSDEAARVVEDPVEAVLRQESDSAASLAASLNSRSLLMLGMGLVMAFVGVAIFYLTLPSDLGSGGAASITVSGEVSGDVSVAAAKGEKAENSLAMSYLLSAIRPTAMLIFIEAIAWFLLRQYRALVEDYKAFHRAYLKRVNYLVAYLAATRAETKAAEENGYALAVIASMLSDDLSGKLREGETTEALEAMRMDENNPVFGFFKTAMEQGRSAIQSVTKDVKSEKKKNAN